MLLMDIAIYNMFQFPSNGKVLLEFMERVNRNVIPSVSIPFKRESPFGAELVQLIHLQLLSFNSLQTGKSFWR